MPALSQPSAGDAVSAISADLEWACPRQPSSPKSRCPSESDPSSPSPSTSASRCPPSSPAATSAGSSCRPPAGSLQGRRSRRHRLEHRRRAARVAHARRAPYDLESELTVSRQGIITRTGDRRGVARFVLVAGGSLLLERSRDPRLHARPLDPRRRPAARRRDARARHARRPRGARRPGSAAAARQRARRAHERDAPGRRGASRPRLRRPGPRRRRNRTPALPALLSASRCSGAAYRGPDPSRSEPDPGHSEPDPPRVVRSTRRFARCAGPHARSRVRRVANPSTAGVPDVQARCASWGG